MYRKAADAYTAEEGAGGRVDEDGRLFLELMELQGSNDMVTKKDIFEGVKRRGLSLSERKLTTYISEGLAPKSARLGTRVGVFPALVVDLVSFVCIARKAQLSFAAIRELLPVWRFLKRSVLHEPFELDLQELERVAGESVRSREAACSIPWMVQGAVAEELRGGSGRQLAIRYRDDSRRPLLEGDPPVISFVVLEPDEQEAGRAFRVGQLAVVLPRTSRAAPDRTTVFVGAPLDAEIVDHPIRPTTAGGAGADHGDPDVAGAEAPHEARSEVA